MVDQKVLLYPYLTTRLVRRATMEVLCLFLSNYCISALGGRLLN